MATTENNITLELAHLDAILSSFNEPDLCHRTVRRVCELGWLQASSVFESAVAELAGIEVISTHGQDFCNGDDAKLSSVRTSTYGKSYSAPICNIHTKVGNLVAQVYERKQNKMYYFYIPHSAFQHIPRTSNIEIPFELDGTPRRQNRCRVNWWDFEVPSLQHLSQRVNGENRA